MSTHRIKFGCALAALSLRLSLRLPRQRHRPLPPRPPSSLHARPVHQRKRLPVYFLRTPGGTHTLTTAPLAIRHTWGAGTGTAPTPSRSAAAGGSTSSNRNDSVAPSTPWLGIPGDVPGGSWDGDGIDTISIQRGSTIFISNAQRPSIADWQFTYGNPGDG